MEFPNILRWTYDRQASFQSPTSLMNMLQNLWQDCTSVTKGNINLIEQIVQIVKHSRTIFSAAKVHDCFLDHIITAAPIPAPAPTAAPPNWYIPAVFALLAC